MLKKKKNKLTVVNDNKDEVKESVKIEGITVVSPMWGERSVTDRMVFSVIHQYLGKDDPINVELVLVDDYLESVEEAEKLLKKAEEKNGVDSSEYKYWEDQLNRRKNGESPYEYYLSEEFKSFYDSEHITIRLIRNKEHKYQGESREIGFLAGKYDWFILIDCDDEVAPNACERYRHIINSYYGLDQEGKRIEQGDLACVHGYVYSFGEHGYEHNIVGHSIWVQGRCYNRKFIVDNEVHFPTGTNSRQGEDYPFICKLDYALRHSAPQWNAVKVPYEAGIDCQATAFWFPNDNSLSRQDPHYGCHLAGWTMASSNSIIEYYREYNKKHGIEDEEDETMKHDVLNMTVYAFYNLLHFLREVASTDYNPKEEDWEELRKNVSRLKSKLIDYGYWAELVYSDIEDMLYQIKHHSDIQFCESWLGTFYDFMNTGFSREVTVEGKDPVEKDILDMNYEEMRAYCSTLQFDGAGHEMNAPYVKAWVERHSPNQEEDKKKK